LDKSVQSVIEPSTLKWNFPGKTYNAYPRVVQWLVIAPAVVLCGGFTLWVLVLQPLYEYKASRLLLIGFGLGAILISFLSINLLVSIVMNRLNIGPDGVRYEKVHFHWHPRKARRVAAFAKWDDIIGVSWAGPVNGPVRIRTKTGGFTFGVRYDSFKNAEILREIQDRLSRRVKA